MSSRNINLNGPIILDIESRNHLQKDCGGDFSKLLIGLTGIKYLEKDTFIFVDENNIMELEHYLKSSSLIIGYNLVGHNGLDYKMLQNYGIDTSSFMKKTYDIMTVLIRTFGSYKGLSLDNIALNTFHIPKKKKKKANYKLLQNGQTELVKANLKRELELIEKLFLRIRSGGLVNFKTSSQLIDEHEIPFFEGFPEINEDVIEPYDFPIGGMRLQIKEKVDKVIKCKKCNRIWQIKSITYYGDTMHEKVFCPHCNHYLTELRSNLFGEQITIMEKAI